MDKTVDEMLADVLKLKNASAETQKTIEELRNVYGRLAAYGSDKIKELTKTISDLTSSAAETGSVTVELQNKFTELASSAKIKLIDISGSFGMLTSVVNSTQGALHALMNSFDKDSDAFNQNLSEMAVKTGALMASFSGLISAPKAFENFATDARQASAAYNDLLSGITGIGDAMSAAFQKADSAKAFESQIIKMSAQAGSLDGVLGVNRLMGPDFDKMLDKRMNDMVMLTVGASNTMGLSIQEGTKRNMEILGSLPMELGRFYSVNEEHGISAMQLLSTVAAGTGQSFDKTIEYSKNMYASFQTTAEGAMERFSLMSRISNELQINFDDMKNTVTGINNGFKMWGDSSKDTLSIMREINTVLAEQGLGYQAGLDVTKSLIDSIKQMSIEKQAFIAMGAGMGGTPLQAGLNVERMMQKGEIGEIARMLQETVSNIGGTGGRILTLDEAATTPGMESAFLAQRQALGMFGITDTGTANRLMDVMSKIQVGGEIADEQRQALQEAFVQGENIQERQYNELVRISNNIDVAVNILASFEAYRAQRTIVGAEGVLGTNREMRRTEQAATLMGETGSGLTVAAYSVGKAADAKAAIAGLGADISSGGQKVKDALYQLGIDIDMATKAIQVSANRMNEIGVEERNKMLNNNMQNMEAAGRTSAIPMPSSNTTGQIPPPSSILGSISSLVQPGTTDAIQNTLVNLVFNKETAQNNQMTSAGQPAQGVNHTINIMSGDENVVARMIVNSITGALEIFSPNKTTSRIT